LGGVAVRVDWILAYGYECEMRLIALW